MMDEEPFLGAPPSPVDADEENEESFDLGAPPPPPPEDDAFLGAPPPPPPINLDDEEDPEDFVLGAPPPAPDQARATVVMKMSPSLSSGRTLPPPPLRPQISGTDMRVAVKPKPISIPVSSKPKPGAARPPPSPDASPRVFDSSVILDASGSALELKMSPPDDFRFQPGDTPEEEVHAQFKIMERLGKGSSGTVYKAVHLATGYVVALKKVAVEDQDEYLSEITFMQKCTSNHVVRYYGHYTFNDYLWILLQYCPVGSVADLMLILDRGLKENQVAAICKGALLGLDELHKARQVHRDIKPENILIAHGGTIKLADFGVASQMTTISNKKVSVVGTPYFMAPEVLTYTSTGYDSKADLWSLAISCIDMAQREPPRFEIAPTQVVWAIPHLPPPTLKMTQNYSNLFNHFLAYALVKDPLNRPLAEQLLQHPFIVDAQPSEEALAQLLQEAGDIIHQAGGIEVAIKAAKKKIKAREKEEFIQSQAALLPAIELTPVEPAPVAPVVRTLIPIEEDPKQKERKKRIIKGKLGRFLHRRPKAAELSGRGIIEDEPYEEAGNKTPPSKLSPRDAAPVAHSRGTLPPASLSTPPLSATPRPFVGSSTPPVMDPEPQHRRSFSGGDRPSPTSNRNEDEDAKKKKGLGSLFGLRKKH